MRRTVFPAPTDATVSSTVDIALPCSSIREKVMVYVNGSDSGLVTSYRTTHGPADAPTPGRLSAVTDTPGR
ncbi:hypothetical protein [Streptomyces tendae]